MSHGLAAMALSGFLSRLTKCAESQDLRLEPLDVRKATLSTVLARASAGIALKEVLRDRAVQVTTSDCRVGRHLTAQSHCAPSRAQCPLGRSCWVPMWPQ
jgi:hypothetical protein